MTLAFVARLAEIALDIGTALRALANAKIHSNAAHPNISTGSPAMTLLIASLGELVVYETGFPRVKALLTVISGFLIIVSAVWYMDSFGSMISQQRFKEEFLRHWSPWFFSFSLINATVCIMLPKRDRLIR